MADKLSRRDFIGKTAAAGIAAALVGAGGGVSRAQEPEEDYWVATLGRVKDLNEKEPVLVKASFVDAEDQEQASEKLFVRWIRINKNTGRWVILSAICRHLKCKVEYIADERRFRCPCHGSEYDIDGQLLDGPAKKPLPDYSADAFEEDGWLKLRREPD